MLPMDAKRNADSYSYPDGMLNSGWIAGVLRNPGDGICYIQQTRSENHMLPIEFDPRKNPLPRDIREWDLVMAYCHVVGAKNDDQRIVRLRSIRFESANMMHLDKEFAHDLMRKWTTKVHEAAKDVGTPPAIETLVSQHGAPEVLNQRIDSFSWHARSLNRNASNHVRLAGFVHAKSLERNRLGPDGKPLNDRLVVLLRQTEDADRCIPIRWYQRNLEPLANTLVRGLPIVVSGEFRLDVKAVGAPDPESGLAPVSKIPYIHAKDLPGPVMPDSGLIKVVPYWAEELLTSYGKTSKSTPVQAEEAAATGGVDRTALFAQAMNTEGA